MSKFIALALTLASANALCANSCSGHGVCREHDQCTCYANWQGNDCSDRTCPFAKSWGDAPYAHNAAHYYSECSSQGTCDRKTGECQCFDGYSGDACRRLNCPDDCSGHGQCRTTSETASLTSVGEFFSDAGSKLDKGVMDGAVSYGLWDAKKTRSCVCDAGYGGINCADMLCPRGDDPLTTEDMHGITEKYEIQTIVVGHSTDSTNRAWQQTSKAGGVSAQGTFTLTFTDSFGKEWTTRPITASDNDDTEYATLAQDTHEVHTGQPGSAKSDITVSYGMITDGVMTTQHHIKDALMSLPENIVNDVEVSMENNVAGKITYKVTFIGSANSGARNLLKCNYEGCNHDGCQPRYVGILPTSNAMCTVEGAMNYNFETEGVQAASQTGTAEDAECSSRGLCDYSSGQCTCFEGYTGSACSVQTILV